jgi:hypothetical protein
MKFGGKSKQSHLAAPLASSLSVPCRVVTLSSSSPVRAQLSIVVLSSRPSPVLSQVGGLRCTVARVDGGLMSWCGCGVGVCGRTV